MFINLNWFLGEMRGNRNKRSTLEPVSVFNGVYRIKVLLQLVRITENEGMTDVYLYFCITSCAI